MNKTRERENLHIERNSVCRCVAVISKDQLSYEKSRRVYSCRYAHPCITSNGTHLNGILLEENDMEEIMIRDNTKKGYRIGKEGDGVVIYQPRARGTVQDQISPTVLTGGGGCGVVVNTPPICKVHDDIALPKINGVEDMCKDRLKALIENPMPEEEVQRLIEQNKLTVRKLTPKECWKLMGMSCEDYYKAAEVCSESQLYKQAGNSIVVDVLEAIFDTILTDTKTVQQTKLYDW